MKVKLRRNKHEKWWVFIGRVDQILRLYNRTDVTEIHIVLYRDKEKEA